MPRESRKNANSDGEPKDKHVEVALKAKKAKKNTGRHACNQCNYTTDRLFDMRNHINAVHLKLRPFKCSECELFFTQKCHLTSHNKCVHEHVKSFVCPKCNRAFSVKANMARHIKTHEEK